MFEALLSWLLSLVFGFLAPIMTLNSIEQVDGYPLYVMHYYGDAAQNIAVVESVGLEVVAQLPPDPQPAWACALFAALADPGSALYGRNFDWQYSPAVLLINHPPDGYASATMVDIAYLGFSNPTRATTIEDLPLTERVALLQAPYWPFDGMNETGLVVGMAAVHDVPMPFDPALPTTGSLGIMREVLDHAATVNEAITIFEQFNIDMEGGPTIHYLLADAHGDSALIEFVPGAMVVLRSEPAWDMATNFNRAGAGDNPEQLCWRFAAISTRLSEEGGVLTTDGAMALLQDVSQPNTQWSIVYGMATGQIDVVMGRQYGDVVTIQLNVTAD